MMIGNRNQINALSHNNMASSAFSKTLELDVRSWADLPSHALLMILQDVDLSDRLGRCSLVCKSWADAARQVTTSICLAPIRAAAAADRHERMQQWLETHGSAVTSISIEGGNRERLVELPCRQLQELQLQECCVLLLPAEKQGVLAAATGLTRLSLADSDLIEEDPFPALTGLSELQDLALVHLESPTNRSRHAPYGSWQCCVPGSVVAALTQLTKLCLDKVFRRDTLQHISRLIKLQHLQLCDVRPAGQSLQGLGQLQQLTALHLQDAQGLQLRKQPDDGTDVLSSLQTLRMDRVHRLDPALLHSMRQLRVLYLHSTPLTCARSLRGVTRSDRTAALLAALPRLQQLQELSLGGHQLGGLVPDLAQYSALTSSSKLKRIGLHDAYHVLASDAWKHIFRPDLQLPALTALSFTPTTEDSGYNPADSQLAMPGDLLPQLVKTCPALVELSLWDAPHAAGAAWDLRPLAQLSALQQLEVQMVPDDSMTHVLAQLTGVTRLVLGFIICRQTLPAQQQQDSAGSNRVPLAAFKQQLLPMVNMKRLQELRILPPVVGEPNSPEDLCFVPFDNKAAEGEPSDVGAQLMQHLQL